MCGGVEALRHTFLILAQNTGHLHASTALFPRKGTSYKTVKNSLAPEPVLA
jgi:hypothetical protein